MNRFTNLGNSAATGSGAIAHTVAPDRAFRVLEVRIKLSAAATQETLTIGIDSNLGAAYDIELDSQAMSGLSEYIFRPSSPLILLKGDELDIAWANTDARTYGSEVVYQEL